MRRCDYCRRYIYRNITYTISKATATFSSGWGTPSVSSVWNQALDKLREACVNIKWTSSYYFPSLSTCQSKANTTGTHAWDGENYKFDVTISGSGAFGYTFNMTLLYISAYSAGSIQSSTSSPGNYDVQADENKIAFYNGRCVNAPSTYMIAINPGTFTLPTSNI